MFDIPLQGNSPQALALAKGIQQKLHELSDRCQQAVANTERSGVRKPAHTIAGKLGQAQKWLANPAQDDKGLGEIYGLFELIVVCIDTLLVIAC